LSDVQTWSFVFALGVLLVAVHFFLLALVANRWTVKPLLTLLIVTTALASHFMQGYGVYLDPSMLRNVIRTDVAEARELFSWGPAAAIAGLRGVAVDAAVAGRDRPAAAAAGNGNSPGAAAAGCCWWRRRR
jgi:glucan phosphoethanolaminetransferase (alkaline phosphatase superfamily)